MRLLAPIVLVAVACTSTPREERLTRVRVAVSGDLAPLDPKGTETYSSYAQDWVFEPLLSVGDAGELIPKLASRWERTERGGIRVQLRAGARFSDGQPVRDEDIAASFDDAGARFQLKREGEWLAIAPSANGDLEFQLVRVAIARKSPSGWIGTGPFVVSSFAPRLMQLRRVSPKPSVVEEIELRSFETQVEAFAHALAGEAEILPDVPSRMVEFFEGVSRLKTLRGHGLHAHGVLLNPRTIDRAGRLALASALPRSEAGEVGARDGCGPVPPTGKATELPVLGGLRLVVVVQDHQSQRLALAIQRYLGTRVRGLSVLDSREVHEQLRADAVDAFFVKLLQRPLSVLVPLFHSGGANNFMRYSNATVDAALDRGDWAAAQAALAQDPAFIPLCIPERLAVVDARFKNARIGPYGFLETVPQWETGP